MRARVKIRKSESIVDESGGVPAPSSSAVRMRRSVPGLLPEAEEEGARRRKSRPSVGMRPADMVCAWLYLPRRCAADVTPAVSFACIVASVSAEAMMTVGLMLLVAELRSTPGCATLVMASEACW